MVASTPSLSKIGHLIRRTTNVQGLRVAIETDKGEIRSGVDEDGHKWRTRMSRPYGYLVGTKGADDEPVDAYVGPDKDAPDAYVVHQHKPDGTGYDEDKIMLAFSSKEDARKAYLEHYDSDKFLGPISKVPIERLQELVESREKLTKISKAVSPEAHVYREQKGNCGPASLRIALRQHGLDVPEKTLARATRTTEGGTSPEDIARVSGGRVRDRMPIGQLKRLTDAGTPVIAAYQDGPADSDSNGHYSVISKVDKNVQLSDPSSKKPLRKIPTDQFAARWHDVDKDGRERGQLGVMVKEGAFSAELRKLAYGKNTHAQLMEHTLQEAFGDHISPDARRLMLDAARSSDMGLRHPWLPWNASVHAFPTSSKKEVREQIKDEHERSIGVLAKAIADPGLGDFKREFTATDGLLGLAQNQHTKLDVHSHIEKPVEMANLEGGPKAAREVGRLRKAIREGAGSLGGFVSSGVEHVRAGFELDLSKGIIPKPVLDRYDPEKYDSDRKSLESSKEYGKEIRKSLVGKLRSEYDMTHSQANEEINKFMGTLSPGFLAESGAEAVDVLRHLGTEAKRLWEGAVPGVLRKLASAPPQPKGIKFVYIDTGGGHKAQAKAMVEAAQKKGIPAEAVDWKEHFAKGDALKKYEDTYADYLQGKKNILQLGLGVANFEMFGTDHDKLHRWAKENKDHAIVLTMEHLQRHFDGVQQPIHVLHSDPVKWPWSPMTSAVTDDPNRIHIGLPSVLDELGAKHRVEIKNVPVSQGVLRPVGKSGLINPRKFNVTVSGGSIGAEVVPLTQEVMKAKLPPGTVIHAVAGKGPGVEEQLHELAKTDSRIKVHGFAPLPKMMREADLNVVRTHGTTFAETVASGKPAVYYGPNVGVLQDFQGDLTRRTAIYAGDHVGHPTAIGLEHVTSAVNKTLENPSKYQRLAAAAKRQMGDPAAQAVRGILMRKK